MKNVGKRRGGVIFVLLVVLFALFLSSCNGISDEEKIIIEQKVPEILEKANHASGMKGNLYSEYSFHVPGENYRVAMDADYEMNINNTEKNSTQSGSIEMYVSGWVSEKNNPVDIISYGFSDSNGEKKTYQCIGDTDSATDWIITVEDEEESTSNLEGNITSFLRGGSDFQVVGTEKIDEKAAIRLDGAADATQFSEALSDVFGTGMEGLTGVKVPYRIWLDPESYELVQFEVDMKEMLDGVMKEYGKALGLNPNDVKVDKMILRMRVNEWNGNYSIVLPEAALEKERLDQEFENWG